MIGDSYCILSGGLETATLAFRMAIHEFRSTITFDSFSSFSRAISLWYWFRMVSTLLEKRSRRGSRFCIATHEAVAPLNHFRRSLLSLNNIPP